MLIVEPNVITPTKPAIVSICYWQEVLQGSDNLPTMYPDLFDQLLTFVEYAVRPPKFGKVDAKSITTVVATQVR